MGDSDRAGGSMLSALNCLPGELCAEAPPILMRYASACEVECEKGDRDERNVVVQRLRRA